MKHWPVLPALTMMNHPARLRVLGMGIIGALSTEGGALELLKKAADQNEPAEARVAVQTSTGAVVGFAGKFPEHYFSSAVDLVDVFYVPGFEDDAM
jgi:hypothetical protein